METNSVRPISSMATNAYHFFALLPRSGITKLVGNAHNRFKFRLQDGSPSSHIVYNMKQPSRDETSNNRVVITNSGTRLFLYMMLPMVSIAKEHAKRNGLFGLSAQTILSSIILALLPPIRLPSIVPLLILSATYTGTKDASLLFITLSILPA